MTNKLKELATTQLHELTDVKTLQDKCDVAEWAVRLRLLALVNNLTVFTKVCRRHGKTIAGEATTDPTTTIDAPPVII